MGSWSHWNPTLQAVSLQLDCSRLDATGLLGHNCRDIISAKWPISFVSRVTSRDCSHEPMVRLKCWLWLRGNNLEILVGFRSRWYRGLDQIWRYLWQQPFKSWLSADGGFSSSAHVSLREEAHLRQASWLQLHWPGAAWLSRQLPPRLPAMQWINLSR